MPTPLRRGLRFAGKSAWYSFALLALLLAVGVGASTQGLRWVESNPKTIASWLSARAKQPVRFSAVRAEWTRRGPLLALSGLHIGPKESAIPMGQAEVLLAPYTGWLPGRRLTELRLHRLALTLERNASGEWHVRGLPGQSTGRDPLDTLEDLGELQVIDGRLRIIAPATGLDVEIPRIDLRVQVNGARVRAGVRAWAKDAEMPLQASLNIDRERGDGRVYAGARRIDLAGWSSLLRSQGAMVVSGRGRAQAWLEMKGHRVAAVTSVSDLRDVALQAVSPTPGSTKEVKFDRLRQRTRFVRQGEAWTLEAPELVWMQAGREQQMDGIVLRRDGQRWAARAANVTIDPLLQVADLSDRLPSGMRDWLGHAKPSGQLQDVQVQGTGKQLLSLSARAQALGFQAVGNAPGLEGIAGRIQGDSDALSLQLDPAARMIFDWPSGFGVPHPITARGTVSLWRESEGIRVGTGDLHIQGGGYSTDARGGLWFQNDGTRPWIDIAAKLGEADVPVARKFWIRHLMPPQAIQWLDMALVDGRVKNGRAIISGDLDNWPFKGNNGRFEARADIENAQLRFQQDWPAIQRARLHATFIGPGMKVQGSGELAGIKVDAVTAEIADFGRGGLAIGANGRGDAAQLLSLLRQSPLEKTLGSTFQRVAASGPSEVTFSLFQPLHHDAPAQRIAGSVKLNGAQLTERELDLAFNNVHGTAQYDGHGFIANQLAVRHEGQPGRLSLRAGAPHVRDRGNAFEADLAATLSSQALLAKAPDMAWLQPYMQGRSEWTVAVALPANADPASARPSRLRLQSNMVGTAIRLPAPLGKAANESLPSEVRIPLPVDAGDVEVVLGRRLALRAQSRGGRTGIRAQLGATSVTGSPPLQGLLVEGRADEVDALAWAGFASGGTNKDGPSIGPVRIDVQAARLLLLGQRYTDARLQMAPTAAGNRVQVQGNGLEGSLDIPQADGATITGRFNRAAFVIGKPSVGPSRALVASPDDVNPARVPPLDIAIQEVRVNGNAIGNLTLKTQPTVAGMRVQSLQLRAPNQTIDAQGQWSGMGGAARTNLDVQIDSRDYGALLGRFGFADQLKKGNGQVAMSLAWPGAPSDFSPSGLTGGLDIEVRDGQLVELEPGAGRVLGLLSVARLPQRLTLDFRDFFDKGFAFDRIEGKVKFGGGLARSEGLVIEGPAAQIDIMGNANMVSQRFDQTIEVRPRTGNLLTAVGAIAGGPVGAAVGAVANAVLKKPLSEVGAKAYRVTGPWDDPKVEVMAKPRAASTRTN